MGALDGFFLVGLAARGLTADFAVGFLALAGFLPGAGFFLAVVFFTGLRTTLARARVFLVLAAGFLATGRFFFAGDFFLGAGFLAAGRFFFAGDFFLTGAFFLAARLAGAAFAGLRRTGFFLVRGDFRAGAFFFPMGCGISVWG